MSDNYYLFIDDSGSRLPDKQPPNRRDGMDAFALGGILIREADRPLLQDAHAEFSRPWKLTYPLHSTDIRGCREKFAWLGEDNARRNQFLGELEAMLCALPVLGFAAIIDRPGYNARYREIYGDNRWLMCKTAYSILIERVAKYVDHRQGKLVVRFESSGPRENADILSHAKSLKSQGQPFNPNNSALYGALTADDFRRVILGEPRHRTKKTPEIQIADLYLYPMAKSGYDPTYRPYRVLMDAKRLIDAVLPESERAVRGIKYSCFERLKNERPE